MRTLLNVDEIPIYYANGSHFDLFNSINTIKRKVQINVTDRRVPGHQDDYCVYENLYWWVQLNVDMDQLVKSLIFL